MALFSLVNRYENEDKYDYLTGLGNVKEFDRHLNEVSSKAEEKKQSLALLLIDIDGFKDVNVIIHTNQEMLFSNKCLNY